MNMKKGRLFIMRAVKNVRLRFGTKNKESNCPRKKQGHVRFVVNRLSEYNTKGVRNFVRLNADQSIIEKLLPIRDSTKKIRWAAF